MNWQRWTVLVLLAILVSCKQEDTGGASDGDTADPEVLSNPSDVADGPPRVDAIPDATWGEFVWKHRAEFVDSEVQSAIHENLLVLEGVGGPPGRTSRDALRRLHYASRLARLNGVAGARHLLVRSIPVSRGSVRLEVARAIARLSVLADDRAEALDMISSGDDHLAAGVLLEMSEEWSHEPAIVELLDREVSGAIGTSLVSRVSGSIIAFRRVRELFDRRHELSSEQLRALVQWIVMNLRRSAATLDFVFPGPESFWVPNNPAGQWSRGAYRILMREHPGIVEEVWAALIEEQPEYAAGRASIEAELAE